MPAVVQSPLPSQLVAVKEELQRARERALSICSGLDDRTWALAPAPGRWSVGDCVIHLNITSERFIPLLDEAIRNGRARGLEGSGPFSRGFTGWALVKYLEPPYRIKTRPPAEFVPARVEPMSETLERFSYLQEEVQRRIDRSAGLALDRIQVVSPIDARVKYNLYASFCIIASHQRRHLWQAEQVLARIRA